MKHRKVAGFTLVELMIGVVILAILSVVATVAYKKYIRKARSTEAITFLSDIKLKQETYFQTYGQYVDTSSSPSSFTNSDLYPSPIGGGNRDWGIQCPQDKGAHPGWCSLGARPTAEEVNYQYVTVGWQIDDPDPPATYIKDPERRWWFAEARGDLDENGIFSTFRLSWELVEVNFWNENE